MAVSDKELLSALKKLIEGQSGPAARRGPGSDPTGSPGSDPAVEREMQAIYERLDQLAESRLANESESLRNAKEQLRIANEKFDVERDILDQQRRSGAITVEAYEQQLAALINTNNEAVKFVDKVREGEEAAKGLANSFGNLFSGKAPDLKGMLDPKNIQGLANDFSKLKDAKLLSQAASTAAVEALKEYSQATLDLAISLGNVEIGFMKATGANQEFARAITTSFAETRTFGASAEETSAAAQGLFTTFTDFTMVSQQTRQSLTETATVMGKLGVSNQDFAQSIQTSTKAMGMSAAQASQNMLDLEKFSRELGVAPSELAGQFAGARDMLAKLGSDGTRAFKDLAIAAKTTGMSIENIVNLTNKFDTFEGAAQQAGQLNAALGGNFVNAMDLMMATNPAERFDMIRDSILDAGLSFDEMSYYQKQFYRDSLGLSDVGELAALMSGDMDLVAGATEESGQSMIDAKKRARELASFQERLSMAFAQMIPILTSVIDFFSSLTSAIANNMNIIKPTIGILIALASALGGPVTMIAGITLGITILLDSIKTGNKQITILGEIFAGIGDVFSFVGDMIDVVTSSFGSFKASIDPEMLEIFAKVARVAGKIIGGVLVVALIGLAGYLASLAAPFVVVIAKLMLAKKAFIAVAAAIAGVAALLFEVEFASNFLEGIVKIANAFSAMAVGVIETLNPFTAMAKLIDSIGNAFTGIIGAVSSFFMIITDPTAAENVMKIGEAITAIPTRKNLEFVGSMGSLAAANTAAAALGTVETVTNVITGNAGAGGSPTPYEVTINVMLERDKLATVTKEIVGEMSRDAARQGA